VCPQAIEGEGLQNVAVLVTRYYGGVKLGAGGLVRYATFRHFWGVLLRTHTSQLVLARHVTRADQALSGAPAAHVPLMLMRCGVDVCLLGVGRVWLHMMLLNRQIASISMQGNCWASP